MGIIEQIERREGAMTGEEFALILNCSSKTLYKSIKKRKLPSIRIGGLIRLCPQTVAEWLRHNLR